MTDQNQRTDSEAVDTSGDDGERVDFFTLGLDDDSPRAGGSMASPLTVDAGLPDADPGTQPAPDRTDITAVERRLGQPEDDGPGDGATV